MRVRTHEGLADSLGSYVVQTSGMMESVTSYLAEVENVLRRVPVDKLVQVIYRLEDARWKGQAIFTCGNGGSATTSIHFASDLAKGALVPDKPPVKARSLCDNIALVTAWGNDVSFSQVFAQCMEAWISSGDVLVAISGSGNSPNVLNAVDLARSAGATTIGFTGFEGGQLKEKVDICITVPCDSMERIEDVHLLLCHLIITCLRAIPVERISIS